MKNKNFPRVGVGVIVVKDNKVLMTLRKGKHATKTWAFLGGWLEFNETIENCARREVYEEAGIKIKNIKFITATQDFYKKENKHVIDLFVVCNYSSGIPRVKEPDKHGPWMWIKWEEMPRPLLPSINSLIKQGYDLKKIRSLNID